MKSKPIVNGIVSSAAVLLREGKPFRSAMAEALRQFDVKPGTPEWSALYRSAAKELSGHSAAARGKRARQKREFEERTGRIPPPTPRKTAPKQTLTQLELGVPVTRVPRRRHSVLRPNR